MRTFYVGQKVVCVDASPGRVRPAMPGFELTKGAVYTVTATTNQFPQPAVQVAETELAPDEWLRASRFRPIVERKTDISVFKAMLNPAPELADAL